jgi:hypothetical protein
MLRRFDPYGLRTQKLSLGVCSFSFGRLVIFRGCLAVTRIIGNHANVRCARTN